jgi:hypothetical protein
VHAVLAPPEDAGPASDSIDSVDTVVGAALLLALSGHVETPEELDCRQCSTSKALAA